jgi:hypothetical protein
MTISDLFRLRLYNQRLIASDFKTPHDVTRWFGAIQAQEVLASLYAVGLRVPGSTETDIEAAITNHSITRAWPMRATIHYMPAEDALWITQLLGPRQNKKAASIYRNYGLTEEIFNKARPILEKTLAHGPKMRSEISEALQAGGVDMSDGRGMHIFKYWGQEGVLCMGPRQGKQQTLALFATWSSHNITPTNNEEAFAILARRYFQSHGPATLRDFVWWTGATVAECKKALDAIQTDISSEVIEGQEYFFTPTINTPTLNPKTALLLPAFDEYTVAYADRTAVMQTNDIKQVAYGINPNIIINGRAVGMWKRIIKGKRAVVQLQPFAPLAPPQLKAIQKAVSDYAAFTGIPTEIEA